MQTYFHHEKLRVYQHSIEFVARTEDILQTTSARAAVRDQLERAAESIPFNIAACNANRSQNEQCRLIDIASGSIAECAACLDVLKAKQLLASERADEEKQLLLEVFNMLFGLRRSKEDQMKEDEVPYGQPVFHHEKLDAYRSAVTIVEWIDQFIQSRELKARNLEVLDRNSTSIVLNIAEGNAKFSTADRAKFFDIAITSGLRTASALDILVARKLVEARNITAGKALLCRTVSLAFGLQAR